MIAYNIFVVTTFYCAFTYKIRVILPYRPFTLPYYSQLPQRSFFAPLHLLRLFWRYELAARALRLAAFCCCSPAIRLCRFCCHFVPACLPLPWTVIPSACCLCHSCRAHRHCCFAAAHCRCLPTAHLPAARCYRLVLPHYMHCHAAVHLRFPLLPTLPPPRRHTFAHCRVGRFFYVFFPVVVATLISCRIGCYYCCTVVIYLCWYVAAMHCLLPCFALPAITWWWCLPRCPLRTIHVPPLPLPYDTFVIIH